MSELTEAGSTFNRSLGAVGLRGRSQAGFWKFKWSNLFRTRSRCSFRNVSTGQNERVVLTCSICRIVLKFLAKMLQRVIQQTMTRESRIFVLKIAIQTLEVKCSYYFRTEGVLVYSAVLDEDYASDVRTHRGRSIVVFQHQVDKFSARDGRRESGAL